MSTAIQTLNINTEATDKAIDSLERDGAGLIEMGEVSADTKGTPGVGKGDGGFGYSFT